MTQSFPFGGTINTAVTGSNYVAYVSTINQFAIDLNINAPTASGTINVYAQNDLPSTSTFSGEPDLTVEVAGGVFPSDYTKFSFSSKDIPAGFIYLNIVWVTAGTPAGSIVISSNLQY